MFTAPQPIRSLPRRHVIICELRNDAIAQRVRPATKIMDNTLDQTTLGTIELLEARLLRIEHILYGGTPPPTQPPSESATTSLAELEHRFNHLVRHFRVYAEILKICMTPPLRSPPTSASHHHLN